VSEPRTGARRYPRTFGGLVGSMIVLVLAVVGYWVVQNLTHDEPHVKPEAVDYLDTVRAVQRTGVQVVYPRTLPQGWIAREPRVTLDDRPVWGLPMLTDDGRFVGIQQEDESLDDLLGTYLPKGAHRGDDVRLPSGLAGVTTWSSWSDGSRDHAFAATVGEDTLLVYGSAPVDDLEKLVGLLTTAALR
jgi:hypothetical protein